MDDPDFVANVLPKMSAQEVTRRYQASLATADVMDRTRVRPRCACCFGEAAADSNTSGDKLTLNSSGNASYRYARHAQRADGYVEAGQNGSSASYFDTSLPRAARRRLAKPRMCVQKRTFPQQSVSDEEAKAATDALVNRFLPASIDPRNGQSF